MRWITATSTVLGESLEFEPPARRATTPLCHRDDVSVVATRRTFKVVHMGTKKARSAVPAGLVLVPAVACDGPVRCAAWCARDQNVKITPTA
jgi:hypothetical protein